MVIRGVVPSPFTFPLPPFHSSFVALCNLFLFLFPHLLHVSDGYKVPGDHLSDAQSLTL
jgi:hypothetical protein